MFQQSRIEGAGVKGERIEIREAKSCNASDIADIHQTARLDAIPGLHQPHTAEETRQWFARAVAHRAGAWWVALIRDEIVGYLLIDGENLDHLYVRPSRQRCGVGSALLNHARSLSPQRLELWTFQRNANARAFYEAHGFRAVDFTDGRNEENEPDVKYVWERPR
jgi:GNAT superfamily N-acetyltransferase